MSYDRASDHLYIRLTVEPVWNRDGSAHLIPGDAAGGDIHLHFDKDGRLVGLDIQDASRKVPHELLAEAEAYSPPFPEGKPP